jgi:hypothetical protein
MKTITIVSKDEMGLLSDISYVLAKEKVNIESISVDVVGEKSVITLGVKDEKKARDALKQSGYSVSEEDVIVVKLEDKPGELSKITKMLAEAKINIHSVLLLSSDGKNTIISFAVDKPKHAEKLLADYIVKNEE